MKRLLYFIVCIWVTVFIPVAAFSQYILNGNAVQESCNCYLLTHPVQWQGGSVWQSTKINLNEPFDFSFNVFLGCLDAEGADGIVFMLQPVSTSLGAAGGGMGFSGVSPSIGIALDTWQNNNDNDPAYDHISIQANGVTRHGNDLAGPIPASASSDNIEDCAWHVFRIKWDPATHTLSTYFDGVFRLSSQTDLVATVFKNDPMVYWGFAAATGGKFNTQKFCTALNPDFSSGLPDDGVCFGTPVTLTDSSTSFTTIKSYYWDFGDGSSSTLSNPPPHTYAQPGIYKVQHSITAADGCVSQPFIKSISIGDKPSISFKIFDTCENISPRILIDAKLNVGYVNQWNWDLDGSPYSTLQHPDFSKLLPGTHSIKLTTASNFGCLSNTYTNNVAIKPNPAITFNTNDGCIHTSVLFSGQQTDNFTTINNWHWDFGNNLTSNKKDTQVVFNTSSNYPVMLTASSDNGCTGSFSKNIFINEAHANAGHDTLVISNTFFQLNGSGGYGYSWSPATGLSNPYISNPMGKVADDTRYLLTVKTQEGCTDTASMKVTVFKGSAIYVPTGFTPNNDGVNDILKPYYIGIKSVSYFIIYNRWGQKIFSTNDMTKGWDGYFQGNQSEGAGYAWVLRAVDEVGKIYNLKGSFILIR